MQQQQQQQQMHGEPILVRSEYISQYLGEIRRVNVWQGIYLESWSDGFSGAMW